MLIGRSFSYIVDIHKFKYSGYCAGFDRKGKFSVSNGFGRNCKIYEADIGSSLHIDNKEKDTLILGEAPIQRLDDKKLTTEKMYWINFTENNKNVCIIMLQIVIYLLMVQKTLNLKQKILKL